MPSGAAPAAWRRYRHAPFPPADPLGRFSDGVRPGQPRWSRLESHAALLPWPATTTLISLPFPIHSRNLHTVGGPDGRAAVEAKGQASLRVDVDVAKSFSGHRGRGRRRTATPIKDSKGTDPLHPGDASVGIVFHTKAVVGRAKSEDVAFDKGRLPSCFRGRTSS